CAAIGLKRRRTKITAACPPELILPNIIDLQRFGLADPEWIAKFTRRLYLVLLISSFIVLAATWRDLDELNSVALTIQISLLFIMIVGSTIFGLYLKSERQSRSAHLTLQLNLIRDRLPTESDTYDRIRQAGLTKHPSEGRATV